MTKLISATAIALIASLGLASAEDYSAGSQAKEWGLFGEEKATFSAKVVDTLCELTGDCADNCGDGTLQLSLVRESDNALIPVLKNRQAAFNGAADDLLPYCNKQVDVDGVLIGDPDVADLGAKSYMIQFIRETGTEKWNKASLWTKAWNKRNPEAKGKGPWFRRDPRVKKQIELSGHFGLGHEADKKFIEENE